MIVSTNVQGYIVLHKDGEDVRGKGSGDPTFSNQPGLSQLSPAEPLSRNRFLHLNTCSHF